MNQETKQVLQEFYNRMQELLQDDLYLYEMLSGAGLNHYNQGRVDATKNALAVISNCFDYIMKEGENND